MKLFFDTSALSKRYRKELGSSTVASLLANSDPAPIITRLGHVELHSVIGKKVRIGEITQAESEIVRKMFLKDIRLKRLSVGRHVAEDFLIATELLTKYAPVRNLRTLDAIQLATALRFKRSGLIDTFVCSDLPLLQFAEWEELSTINPEMGT